MTERRDDRLLLLGTDEPPPPRETLKAGLLTATLEGGNLRHIKWHGVEVLRAVAYLVRDENWSTYAPELIDLEVQEHDNGFIATYSAGCLAASGVLFSYDARIEGRADGSLSFDVSGSPNGDFFTNRCGFCVLHPIVGVAGEPAEIQHVDGSVQRSRFPDRIDPLQPFVDIRGITHTAPGGITVGCRMVGDTFEMEDQRNWTDASYKTYVRPLALPWPYKLAASETVEQSVTVTLVGQPRRAAADRKEAVIVSVSDPVGACPRIGLVVTPDQIAATRTELRRLEEIAPQDLVLSYNPRDGHTPDHLRAVSELVERSSCAATLEFVVPCLDTPERELRELADLVGQARLRLAALSVSPWPDLKATLPGGAWPDCPPLDAIYAAAKAAFPGLRLGGGTLNYFTELNRKRPPAGRLDFITHTTAPTIHAADDVSVMETLEALPYVTRSVRALFGDMAFRIGPATIGMRHNPYGGFLAENPGARARMTMTADDPRQRGLFAAAWMIGYAAATADARLETLTVGALTGSFGVLGEAGARPAFHTTKALAKLAGTASRETRSSDPGRVLALSGGDSLIVANLTPEQVRVELPRHSALLLLDADALARSNCPRTAQPSGRLVLDAYAIGFATLSAT